MDTNRDTLIHFPCCKCAAGLRALPVQSGRSSACPKCGAMNVVPGDPQEADCDAAADHRHAAQIIADIPVVCGLCSTRMYATAAQLGEQLKCPDCGKLTEVKQPQAPRSTGTFVAPPLDEGDEYQLSEADNRTRSETQPRYFVFFCSLCSTQLRATAEHSGEQVRCPDCGREMIVPAPPEDTGGGPLVDEGPELALGEAAEVKPAELLEHQKPRIAAGVVEAPIGLRRDYGYANEAPPPKYPFATRVVSFLFDQSTLSTCLALGITLGALAVAMIKTIVAIPAGGGAGAAITMVGVLVSFLAIFILALVWPSVATACHLTIISETAAGNDKIVAWPELLQPTSWFGSIFYGVNLLAACALPVAIAAAIVSLSPEMLSLLTAASMFLLAPPVVLSMLAGNSPLYLYSSDVIRRMNQNKRSCAIFYAATGGVYGVVIGCSYLLALFVGFWPIFVLAIISVMATFLIARLIGRLGWVLRQTPDEEDEDVVQHDQSSPSPS